MSSDNIKHTFDYIVSKHVLATTVKLNEVNNLLWAQFFSLFVGSQKKLKHLIKVPPTTSTTAYDDWVANDCSVMTRLLSSMVEMVSCF